MENELRLIAKAISERTKLERAKFLMHAWKHTHWGEYMTTNLGEAAEKALADQLQKVKEDE